MNKAITRLRVQLFNSQQAVLAMMGVALSESRRGQLDEVRACPEEGAETRHYLRKLELLLCLKRSQPNNVNPSTPASFDLFSLAA